MSTPAERVRDTTRRLLTLLEEGESTTPEAITLRAELAEATAETGQLEDAFYQADELLKDARREHGEEHEATVRALAGIGISVARFAGRDDLHSPASQPGTHDDNYFPAYITARHENGVTFSSLESLAAAAFNLDPDDVEVVIDLRDSAMSALSDDARLRSDQAREQPVHE